MSNTLYIEYDENIDEVPTSILQIPAVSGIVTLAWLTGADVYVKELDAEYLKSLERIRTVMKDMYPEFPFSKIYVDKIVLNEFNNDGYGLLFSGGLDSVTSYIRHRDKKPSLIHCLVKEKQFKTNINHLINFSKEEDVTINVIKTNVYDILHALLIYAQFGITWWPNIAHAIVLTGLSAPLMQKNDVGTLLIASSHTQEFKYPWGTDPSIANNIQWADVQVVHDGYDLSRQQKIRQLLKNCIASPDSDTVLKVLAVEFACESSSVCGKCTKCVSSNGCIKCLRNIVGLALEGIDPNLCGFNCDMETFDFTKQSFIEGNYGKSKILIRTTAKVLGKADELFFWRDIQKHIPEIIEHDLYNSKEFFYWFKNFDITEYRTKNRISELPSILAYTISFRLYPLYCSLPLDIFRRLRKLYF